MQRKLIYIRKHSKNTKQIYFSFYNKAFKMEVFKKELELFSKPSYQHQIEKTDYREFHPLTTLQHQTPIEFLVTPIEGRMPDFSRSQLLIRAKITKSDATKIDAGAHVSVVNIPIHSMWSSIEVFLGDTRISDANSLLPYRAIIETLLGYRKEELETLKQTAIFAKDTAGSMNVTKTSTNEATNLGLNTRAAYFAESKIVEMIDRLHIDIAYPDILLPTRLSIRIRLLRSPDNFVLIADGGTVHRFEITQAKLFVPFKALTEAQHAAFENAIALKSCRIPIRRVELKHFTIPAGLTTPPHNNLYSGRLPKRIIMCMVTQTSMSGSFTENPFNFQHFDLEAIALNVNGDMVPAVKFQPDFTNGLYMREYMSLFDGMDISHKGLGIIINREDFSKGYTFFVFDLSSDNDPNSQFYDSRRSGHVYFEMRFGKAIASAINVIVYGEFLGEILIDKYRNVLTDF